MTEIYTPAAAPAAEQSAQEAQIEQTSQAQETTTDSQSNQTLVPTHTLQGTDGLVGSVIAHPVSEQEYSHAAELVTEFTAESAASKEGELDTTTLEPLDAPAQNEDGSVHHRAQGDFIKNTEHDEQDKPKKSKAARQRERKRAKRLEESGSQPGDVDLSRLKNFNEERSERIEKTPRIKAPPVLLSSKGASLLQSFLDKRRPSANDEEGVSHINASPHSTLPLGRALGINNRNSFVHPHLGRFASLSGLWYWLTHGGDDTFRGLTGLQVQKYAWEKKLDSENVEGLAQILADALWLMVNQNEPIKKGLLENTLPWRSYLVAHPSNLRTKLRTSDWHVGALEEISRTLKAQAQGAENVRPDFSFLSTVEKNGEDHRPPRRDGVRFERNDRGDNGRRQDRQNHR